MLGHVQPYARLQVARRFENITAKPLHHTGCGLPGDFVPGVISINRDSNHMWKVLLLVNDGHAWVCHQISSKTFQ